MDAKVQRVLIGRDAIAARVADLGARIARDVAADAAGESEPRIVLVPILTGAMVFVADLIRNIPLKMSIAPVTVTSYPGRSVSSQGANVRGDLPTDLQGAHVLLVDDILDSGRTLGLLRRVFEAQRPASLRLVVLLQKRKSRDEHVRVDYAGFEIEDEFVVGYGLDYDGYFRNVPDIVTIEM